MSSSDDSGSVKTSTGVIGDSASFTFSQLASDNTNNCEIHVQSTGGSAGWQVGVQAVTYSGDLTLKPGTQLDAYTQIFWSDKAAETVSQTSFPCVELLLTKRQSVLTGHITCAGPEIRDSFTLRQSTDAPKFSKCTGDDGNPGILNVNARPVISGNDGAYNIKSATWNFVWRKC
jgi:hypothetical protein